MRQCILRLLALSLQYLALRLVGFALCQVSFCGILDDCSKVDKITSIMLLIIMMIVVGTPCTSCTQMISSEHDVGTKQCHDINSSPMTASDVLSQDS
jgi:hypothetical protein